MVYVCVVELKLHRTKLSFARIFRESRRSGMGYVQLGHKQSTS